MASPLDPATVEADLARYYDEEGDERLSRPVDARRVAALEAFVRSLPRGRRILEIGSGPGRDATSFLRAGHSYVAVDLSYEHARRCRATGAQVGLASVRALPFPRGSFDAVWTMSTLMHVPDSAIASALSEVRRVLTPGGAAAIGVWGGPDVEDHSAQDRSRGRVPRLFSRRSNERWRSMLERVGPVESFETWADGDDFFYQLAVVRRP